MLFDVEVDSLEEETVLALHGELDASTQQIFASALAGVVESATRIVLDLSDLTFMDCGNIGLINRSQIAAAQRGASVELRSPNPRLVRLMELTGLLPSGDGEAIGPIALPLPSRVYERAV